MKEMYTDNRYKYSHKKNAKSFAKALCKALDIKPHICTKFTASQLHSFTASQLHSFTASQLHSFTAEGFLCPNKTIKHSQIFSHHTHKTEFPSLCVFYSTTDWDNPKHKIP